MYVWTYISTSDLQLVYIYSQTCCLLLMCLKIQSLHVNMLLVLLR
jgi:hypothetical protein